MAETPEQEPQTPDAAVVPPPPPADAVTGSPAGPASEDEIVPPAAPEAPAWTAPSTAAPAAWTPTQVPGTGSLPDTVVPSSAPPANPYAPPAPPANPYAPPVAPANPYAPPAAPANPYASPASAAPQAGPSPAPIANPYAPAGAAPGTPYPTGPYGQVDPNRPNPYAPAQGVTVGAGYGQAPPTYPGYAPSYAGYPVVATPPKGLSVTSMILGIAGLLIGFFFVGLLSVAALVTGIIARRREPAARAFWLTGIITGAVGLAFGLIIVIIYVIAIAASMSQSSYY